MEDNERTLIRTSQTLGNGSHDWRLGRLCTQCRSLNVDDPSRDRLTPAVPTSKKITISKDSSCLFCRLVHSICVPDEQAIASDLTIEAHVELIRAPFLPFNLALRMLAPASARNRYIVPHRGSHDGKTCTPYVKAISKEAIDWSIPRNWLSLCDTNHADSCALPYMSRKQVPRFGFKLIDCEKRTIVRAELDYRYVALSYVWGTPSTSAERPPIISRREALFEFGERDIPLGKVSKTVEDAILATLALEFKYIWVDKHCIAQNDSGDLENQLPMMNQIYESASMTIIAAAGANSSYGLPGLSRARHGPPTTQIGRTTWSAGHATIASPLQFSPWYERAWTYQEAIFSHRRLIFTDEQLFFECNKSACCEMVAFNVNTEYHAGGSYDAVFIKSALRLDTLSFLEHLELYTKRTLSHQSDVLKAVQGLFRSLTSGDRPQLQYWGIPIQPRTYSKFKT